MSPELELVNKWLQRARSDLRMAEIALDSDQPESAGACFHCQQAVEKSLKAFLVFRDVEFEWSHEIGYLLGLCCKHDGAFGQFDRWAEQLTGFAVRFRYPLDRPDPPIEQAQETLALARQLWQSVLDRLPAETHPPQIT